MTDAQINTLEGGNGHTGVNYTCNSDAAAGIALGAFTTTDLAGDSAGGGLVSFIIGSLETSQCVSRFGAQDLVGNIWNWTSDQLTNCSTVTHTCQGATSGLDSGNTDLNIFNFDGVQGPGGVAAGQVPANYTDQWFLQNGIVGGSGGAQGYGAGYFSAPLGLPLVGNDNGNAILISNEVAKFHQDFIQLYTDTGSISRAMSVGGPWSYGPGNGRWESYWVLDSSGGTNIFGFRCALPAE